MINYELYGFSKNSGTITVLTKGKFIHLFPKAASLKDKNFADWVTMLNMKKTDSQGIYYLPIDNTMSNFVFILKDKVKGDLEKYLTKKGLLKETHSKCININGDIFSELQKNPHFETTYNITIGLANNPSAVYKKNHLLMTYYDYTMIEDELDEKIANVFDTKNLIPIDELSKHLSAEVFKDLIKSDYYQEQDNHSNGQWFYFMYKYDISGRKS